jgi:hypothetical protein
MQGEGNDFQSAVFPKLGVAISRLAQVRTANHYKWHLNRENRRRYRVQAKETMRRWAVVVMEALAPFRSHLFFCDHS